MRYSLNRVKKRRARQDARWTGGGVMKILRFEEDIGFKAMGHGCFLIPVRRNADFSPESE
jgi:hypothetical protein